MYRYVPLCTVMYRPEGPELFCAEGRTSRRCRLLFEILRPRLNRPQLVPYSKTMTVCSETRIKTICVQRFESAVMWT
jgi:hypothetical protein